MARASCVVLALGCRTDDAAPASVSALATDSVDPACPLPAEGVECLVDAVWARDPSTDACCRYSRHCTAPAGWMLFASESECQTSCRCSDLTPLDTPIDVWVAETERVSFECACADGSCRDETLEEALRISCSEWTPPGPTVTSGCGMVEIDRGYLGRNSVFDRDSGALIGSMLWSDVPLGPCRAYQIIIGREFVCDDVTECALCTGDAGTSSGGLPACDL